MANGDDSFEIFKDKRGRFRWRRHDAAGTVVGAATEGYVSRSDCEANMTRGAVPTDKWDFYIDKRGAHRWRRYAANGRLVGAGSRGFATRAEAEDNARRQGFTG